VDPAPSPLARVSTLWVKQSTTPHWTCFFAKRGTYAAWQQRPVPDETLRELYELPNGHRPARTPSRHGLRFSVRKEAKERLRPALAPGNIEKTMTAPVTAIIAYDMNFYDQLPKLFPQSPGMKQMFETNPQLVEVTARRNSDLQGAYLILAARGARS